MSKGGQAQFFDAVFEDNVRHTVDRAYAISAPIHAAYSDYLRAHVARMRVLELGCGPGSHAFFVMEHEAEQVIGIDISEVGIRLANQRAQMDGLANATFQVMNAEAMVFKPASFDVVCGTGILHHLDIERALSEITRVLTPQGRAIFIEPLGYNPVINLFRLLTPRLRVNEEHPLLRRDLDDVSRYFHQVNFRFFFLLTVPASALPSGGFRTWVIAVLNSIDQWFFKSVPGLKYLAWQILIIAENPVASAP